MTRDLRVEDLTPVVVRHPIRALTPGVNMNANPEGFKLRAFRCGRDDDIAQPCPAAILWNMLAALALIAAMQASPADPCSRYVLPADGAQRATYAAAVQKAARKPTPPASIAAVLGSPGWRVVWALPDDSERGVFIFREQPGDALRFVDVWSGSLGPDGPKVVVAWLRKTAHMPLPLARCVAERVAREGA